MAMADGRHPENRKQTPRCLNNTLTDFVKIYYADAHWPSRPVRQKKLNFKNSIWRTAIILKIIKIAKSYTFDQFRWNLVCWWKFQDFINPRWWTATILWTKNCKMHC